MANIVQRRAVYYELKKIAEGGCQVLDCHIDCALFNTKERGIRICKSMAREWAKEMLQEFTEEEIFEICL